VNPRYSIGVGCTVLGFMVSFLPSLYFIYLTRTPVQMWRTALGDPADFAKNMEKLHAFSAVFPALLVLGLLITGFGMFTFLKASMNPAK
jgi:hypothetical protein